MAEKTDTKGIVIDDLSPELDPALQEQLYARHVEIKSLSDLEMQRGTPIPALFNMFFKFIQNPSTVSIETFKRMVDTDDTVGSGVDFLTTLLAARMGTYQHPSDEITAWVNEALKRTKGGFYNSMKEMLSASWAGFSVAEQVWANTDHGFIVEKIMNLPPSSILFEVDRTGELTKDGILQYQRNYNPSLIGGGGVFGYGFQAAAFPSVGRPDPLAKLGDLPYPIRVGNTFQYLSIRIPVQKCIHYSFDAQGKFQSPYGRSLLRRAYNFWVMKNAFLQMLSVSLDRKGTPLLVVFADPNATMIDPDKTNQGQNMGTGRGKGIRADVAALNAFKDIHNDTVVVLPGKKDQVYSVDPVQVQANAQEFITAIDRCDRGILRALLIPALIFSAGDGTGSYSLGQEHSKTFEKVLDGILAGFKPVLIEQHISRMIKFNFPESAWKKDGFGDFSKRDFSQDEIQKILQAAETMVNMGAVSMDDLEDLNKVREMGGFSMRKKPFDRPTLSDFGLDEEGEDDGGDTPIGKQAGAKRGEEEAD